MQEPGLEQAHELLRRVPTRPTDVARFSSNTLFGQPGVYPEGPPMVPAEGAPLDEAEGAALLAALLDEHERDAALALLVDPDLRARVPDAAMRVALLLLTGGPAAPELDAFLAEQTQVLRFGIGELDQQGRVIGTETGEADGARLVLNARYRAEHPAVVAPSLAHALCHHATMASSAEEATLHGLLAAVHTWLLAGQPAIADLGTELSRRQASLTITLLNARPPGEVSASIRCPDGPGTIPGGNPDLQCPDLWSIPFSSLDPSECDLFVPAPVRDSLARLAAGTAPPPPEIYDESLGRWLTDHLGDGVWFGPVVRARAGLALGLHGDA
jgi:hypothetical protein